MAFQSFVTAMLFNVDYEDIQPEEIVDGGFDKQIDVIRVEDDDAKGSAHIHIIQAKNTGGFSSNTLIQMANGLSWIFERPMVEVNTLENNKFRDKISEVRSLRKDYGTSNISVTLYYITVGDGNNLSAEYLQEKRAIQARYKELGFANFEIRELGAFELFEMLNSSQKIDRTVDIDMHLVYDMNRNSIIEYGQGETRALICTVTGSELARIAQSEPRDAIFDLNVRPYYGDRGKVNSEIKDTCTSDNSHRFWFLNNGVTMTCDTYDLNRDPDNPLVKVKNAQIVNGCQTTVTIREAYEQGLLRADVKLLVRIYATDNPRLIDKITLTTNNQNKITDRDLRANDEVQRDIQHMMQEWYSYYYERKNKEFRDLRRNQRSRIIPNTKAAQAYLAIVRRKPSVARGYMARIWSDHYSEIFSNATVEDLLSCFLIYRHCLIRAKWIGNMSVLPQAEIQTAVYGMFHIARVMGYILRNDAWGKKHQEEVKSLVRYLDKIEQERDDILADVYDQAARIVTKIREETITDVPNPALYFKASAVEKAIEKAIKETPIPTR